MSGRTCDEPGCDRPHWARGLCSSHYNKLWKQQNPGRGRGQSRGRATERTCDWCGTTFQARERSKARNGHWFCSRICYDAWRPTQHGPPPVSWPRSPIRIVDCVQCGQPFIAHGPGIRSSICSAQCRRERHSAGVSASIQARYRRDPNFRSQVIAASQARRATKLGLGGTRITITYLIARDGNRCGICRKPVRAKRGPMRPSIDHIIPLSRGGTHDPSNVQLAHLRCNLSKNNRGSGEQLRLLG